MNRRTSPSSGLGLLLDGRGLRVRAGSPEAVRPAAGSSGRYDGGGEVGRYGSSAGSAWAPGAGDEAVERVAERVGQRVGAAEASPGCRLPRVRLASRRAA